MRNTIIKTIHAIEAKKKVGKIEPAQATKMEVQRAVQNSFAAEYAELVEDGTIIVTGHTINKDDIIGLME